MNVKTKDVDLFSKLNIHFHRTYATVLLMSSYFSFNTFVTNDSIKVFIIVDTYNQRFYYIQLVSKYRN